MFVNLNNIE